MFEASRPDAAAYISTSSARDIFHQHARVERHVEHFFAGVGRHPVAERRAEIHQRVADRHHFPIEHRGYSRQIVGVEHYVVEFVIVVDKRCS